MLLGSDNIISQRVPGSILRDVGHGVSMSPTGLIGHTGFVGSNLTRLASFDACYNSQTIAEIRGTEFDLLVCAAPQAKKWWANQHPEEDKLMVQQLIDCLKQTRAKRFVLISSIDVFPRITDADESFDCTSQKNHAYGQNRLVLEQFVADQFPIAHIIRLPGLFGSGLKKNVIFDLLNVNQLEKIHPDSQFQWYGLPRLWADIQVILDNDVRLMVMATEPVATQSIQSRFFPDLAIGSEATAPVFYNIKTCYADLFSGQSGYILSKSQILDDIGQFIQHERQQST